MEKENIGRKKYIRRVLLVCVFLFAMFAAVFSNANVDPTYVELANVTHYITDSRVIIYWDTTSSADTLVKYGLTADNLSNSSYMEVNTLAHAVELTGLNPLTTYYYVVNSTNALNASNQSDVYSFTTSQDITPPYFSNVSAQPFWSQLYQVNYSKTQTYLFSATWQDNSEIGSVRFVHDFDGNSSDVLLNDSNGTSIYSYSHGPFSVGTYHWMMIANDTDGNTNQTQNYLYVVNASSPSMQLLLNGVAGNISLEQKSIINVSGLLLDGEGGISVRVYNSSSTINQSYVSYNGSNSGNSSMSNESAASSNTTVSLSVYLDAPGMYNVTLSYNATANYTSREITYVVNVTSINVSMLLDNFNYSLGNTVNYRILAPNGSNLTVTVCGPLVSGGGFVECRIVSGPQIQNFAYLNYHSITNKSGVYNQKAQISYKGLIRSSEINYSVANNIAISFSGDTSLKTGVQSRITASATGGVGTLSYNWTLSNGTKISGQNLNTIYNTAGTYSAVVMVTDAAGNYNSTPISLVVKNHYNITVLVTDSNNAPIESASVRIGDTRVDTNQDGEAFFDVYEDQYTLKVSASGYDSYASSLTANANSTINVKLNVATASSTNISSSAFSIQLISPQNYMTVNPGDVTFQTNVNLGIYSSATCQFYISQDNSGWYSVMGTLGVTTTGQISHNQTLESGKSYSWKVQCDTSSATYSSDIYNLTVLGAQQNSEVGLTILSNLSSPIIDAGEIRNRLESAITNIEGLDMESKNDAGSLQVSDKIDAALQTYDRAMRDINNIIYRRDLTVQEQQDKKQEYYNTLQALENITPYNVKTISHDTFISYPLKSELINISEDYRAQKKIVGKLDSEKLMVLQNKLIVTSRVSNVEITYINGRTEVLTLVVKELKLTDNATDTFLLEAVPKDFAASSDDIVFLNDVKIINKDPLIRMDKQNSTIYYVSKQIDLAVAKRSQTMVMSDSLFSTKGGVSSLTGAVTFTNIDFTSPTSLIVIVVIISCLYMVYAFDLFGSVFGNGKNKSNKKVEDILNLIRDAKYFLQTSEVNKADMVFAEIKLRYEIAPDDVKAEVYNESMSLLELIDSAQLDLLIKVAEQQTMYPAEQEEILSSRDALKRAYELLSDQLKNKYVDRINSTIDEENSVLNSWHTRSQTRSVLGNQNNQSYQNNKNNQDRGNV